ncbi:hypothetical protein ACFXB3_07260 [Streptomyces sp. NPDC059447]|uniref:hypothetical protein n=1 Tax=Streptomyces sp. NPDC059447 TaxID=3346834 RepID=UPI00367AD2F0
MPKFQIVTTDNITYTEGASPLGVFADLGVGGAVLENFRYEPGYVVLKYSDDLELRIPEHRIKYIAKRFS